MSHNLSSSANPPMGGRSVSVAGLTLDQINNSRLFAPDAHPQFTNVILYKLARDGGIWMFRPWALRAFTLCMDSCVVNYFVPDSDNLRGSIDLSKGGKVGCGTMDLAIKHQKGLPKDWKSLFPLIMITGGETVHWLALDEKTRLQIINVIMHLPGFTSLTGEVASKVPVVITSNPIRAQSAPAVSVSLPSIKINDEVAHDKEEKVEVESNLKENDAAAEHDKEEKVEVESNLKKENDAIESDKGEKVEIESNLKENDAAAEHDKGEKVEIESNLKENDAAAEHDKEKKVEVESNLKENDAAAQHDKGGKVEVESYTTEMDNVNFDVVVKEKNEDHLSNTQLSSTETTIIVSEESSPNVGAVHIKPLIPEVTLLEMENSSGPSDSCHQLLEQYTRPDEVGSSTISLVDTFKSQDSSIIRVIESSVIDGSEQERDKIHDEDDPDESNTNLVKPNTTHEDAVASDDISSKLTLIDDSVVSSEEHDPMQEQNAVPYESDIPQKGDTPRNEEISNSNAYLSKDNRVHTESELLFQSVDAPVCVVETTSSGKYHEVENDDQTLPDVSVDTTEVAPVDIEESPHSFDNEEPILSSTVQTTIESERLPSSTSPIAVSINDDDGGDISADSIKENDSNVPLNVQMSTVESSTLVVESCAGEWNDDQNSDVPTDLVNAPVSATKEILDETPISEPVFQTSPVTICEPSVIAEAENETSQTQVTKTIAEHSVTNASPKQSKVTNVVDSDSESEEEDGDEDGPGFSGVVNQAMKKKKKQMRVLVCSIGTSGKTAMVSTLKEYAAGHHSAAATKGVPTVSSPAVLDQTVSSVIDVETVVLAHKKFAITLLDLKGDLSVIRNQLRDKWLSPFIIDESVGSGSNQNPPSIDAIVFPVDAADPAGIQRAKQLLNDLAKDLSASPVLKKLKKKLPILIVANKQDLPNAVDCDDVTKQLSSSSLLSTSSVSKVDVLPFSCGDASDNNNNKILLKWIMKQSPHYKKKLKLAKTLKKLSFFR